MRLSARPLNFTLGFMLIVARINCAPMDTCPAQKECITMAVSESTTLNTCSSPNDCEFTVCLTLSMQGSDCPTSISHSCIKSSSTCQSGDTLGFGSSGTEEVVSLSSGYTQCQTAGPNTQVEFLLKDGSGCGSVGSVSVTGATGTASCSPRVDGTTTCTGNAISIECIWTYTTPTCSTAILTTTPTTSPTTTPTNPPTTPPPTLSTTVALGTPTSSPTTLNPTSNQYTPTLVTLDPCMNSPTNHPHHGGHWWFDEAGNDALVEERGGGSNSHSHSHGHDGGHGGGWDSSDWDPCYEQEGGHGGHEDDGESGPTCFAPDAKASVLGKGEVPMKNLAVGDKILTASGEYKTVFTMDHFHPSKPTIYLQIHIKQQNKNNKDQSLELTSKHMLFTEGKTYPVPASHVKTGDKIMSLTGPKEVIKIKKITRQGLYNPMTTDGTIVVDGMIASTYASYDNNSHIEISGYKLISFHTIADMAFIPYRAFCTTNPVSLHLCNMHDENPIVNIFMRWVYDNIFLKRNDAVKISVLVIYLVAFGLIGFLSQIFVIVTTVFSVYELKKWVHIIEK